MTESGSDKNELCKIGKEKEIVIKENDEETEKEEIVGRSKRNIKKPDRLNL